MLGLRIVDRTLLAARWRAHRLDHGTIRMHHTLLVGIDSNMVHNSAILGIRSITSSALQAARGPLNANESALIVIAKISIKVLRSLVGNISIV